MKELCILSPTAILGYGFPEASFIEGMKHKPDVIAVDAGSTDPGPYYLGAGLSFTDHNAVMRDLSFMIPAALEAKIPVIIGTAGGSGAKPHLDWQVDIIEELAKTKNLSFKMAVISSDVSQETVLTKLKEGKILPLHPAPELKEQDIIDSVQIVGQMGVEPIIYALEEGADVIVAGRAYDPAVFAALAVKNGYDRGLSTHLGKILECAAIAASPGSGSDCMIGWVGEDYFRVDTLSSARKCTVKSVAAHTLYEKTNPYILPGPGGVLNLTNTVFTQETDSAVKVTGSVFEPSNPNYVKLEGVKSAGFRTVSICATADPVMMNQIDNIIAAVKDRVKSNFAGSIGDFKLDFKIYGRNGVMGIFEAGGFPQANQDSKPHEFCFIIDAVAPTQEAANTICSFARSTLLHYGYEGRISTAGNLAFPFSPSDFKVGEVFEFSIYHLMEAPEPLEHFKVEIRRCGK
ncbi:MAG: DUF1446 domain-containing protein [Defluviitaleaceae bacterium]|nr:DUF1446 domain-containing protein [Defluviitaleaceae bacterium]